MEAENRFLIADRKSSPPVIDSQNLFYYLMFGRLYPQRQVNFTRQLDLGYLAPAINLLYDETKDVFVLGQQNRDNLLNEENNLRERYSQLGVDFPTDALNQQANLRAAAERSSVFYYDISEETYKYTPPHHGEYKKTDTEYFRVVDEGNLPALDIHTHPSDSLFSPQDYVLMITDLFQYGIRPLGGMLLLCPKVQVLALATHLTPLIDSDQFEEFRNKWKDIYAQVVEGRPEVLNDRMNKIIAIHGRNSVRELESGIQRVREIVSAASMGEPLSPDEIRQIAEDVMAERLPARERLTERAQKIISKTDFQGVSLIRQKENQLGIELARMLNIELFFSTDRRNFKQFAA